MPTRNRKTDRKQNKACDACRFRRVKCERESEGAPCQQCLKKNLHCFSSVAQRVREPAGVRLLEARRRYGVTPEEADATVNSSPDVDGAFDQTGSFEFEPEPEPEAGPSSWPRSPTTPSGQNAVVPIPQWAHLSSTATENLLADLVDIYFQSSHFQHPAVDWTRFSQEWELSNKRYLALDPHTQVLVVLMCSLGARLSNHPLIVGVEGCPSVQDPSIWHGLPSSDLEAWGFRRAAVCGALERHAEHLFDSRRILWTPVAQSATCALLLIIVKFQRPEPLEPMLLSLTTTLMRSIHNDVHIRFPHWSPEELAYQKQEARRLAVLNYLTDSILVAQTGLQPAYTEEDVAAFCPAMQREITVPPSQGADVEDQTFKEVMRENSLGCLAGFGRLIRKHLFNKSSTQERVQALRSLDVEWKRLEDRLCASGKFALTSKVHHYTLLIWWRRGALNWKWRFCRILRDRLRTLAHEATQEPYDPAYIHELNLRIFNAEKQTLQSLRELAEWDRSVISPRRQIFHTILPMRFSHDFSKGVVDIKDKSSEVMPEWNIEDQVKDAEILYRSASSMRFAWGRMASIEEAEEALQELYVKLAKHRALCTSSAGGTSGAMRAVPNQAWQDSLSSSGMQGRWSSIEDQPSL